MILNFCDIFSLENQLLFLKQLRILHASLQMMSTAGLLLIYYWNHRFKNIIIIIIIINIFININFNQ